MIYLFGAGGHAKVILDMLAANHLSCAGVFDANSAARVWELPYFSFPGPYRAESDDIHISIGNNVYRRRVVESCKDSIFLTIIHPKALISSRVRIGAGTAIMGSVTVNADACIGNHVILNTSCSVDHDCIIEDFVHVGPGSTLCGQVTVGEGTLIGAGCVIIPGIRIGKNATIGAGSVVLHDVPADSTAVGSPARIIHTNRT